MNCRRCGNQILENEKFCRVCGEPVVNQINNIPKQTVQNQLGDQNIVQTQPVNSVRSYIATEKSSSKTFTLLFFISCIILYVINIMLQFADIYTAESVVATYIKTSSILLGVCGLFSFIANALINGSKVQVEINSLDDELVASYIGDVTKKNNALVYKNVKSKKINFNLFSILAGPIYYIYRKMYIEALIIAIAEIAISFIPEAGFLILILGFVFYPLYRRHINKEIEIIKSTSNDFESQKKLCSEKGGTNIKICAVAFIVYILAINFFTVSKLAKKTYDLTNVSFTYDNSWKLNNIDTNTSSEKICIDNKALFSGDKKICINIDEVKTGEVIFEGAEKEMLKHIVGPTEALDWNLIQQFTKKDDYYVAKFSNNDTSLGYIRVYFIIKSNNIKSNLIILTAYNKDSNDFESIEKVIDTIKFK